MMNDYEIRAEFDQVIANIHAIEMCLRDIGETAQRTSAVVNDIKKELDDIKSESEEESEEESGDRGDRGDRVLGKNQAVGKSARQN